MIYSNVPENDAPAYDSSVSYGANSIVMWPLFHRLYKSLVDNNQGNPLYDTTKWLMVGYNNRWKVHDGIINGSVSSNPLSIRNIYKVSGAVDSVALLSVAGTQASVKVYNTSDQLVYSSTKNISLVINGAANWDDFFLTPLAQLNTDLLFDDIPYTINPTIDITISAPNNSVSCGEILIGDQLTIGATQYGAKTGYTDFSVKTQDQFGNYSITPRGYRKTGEFQVFVDNANIDYFANFLARYRAQGILFVGSSTYLSTMIYGFIKDYSNTIQYPNHSIFNVSVEGVT
jgi:hypothetical protein